MIERIIKALEQAEIADYTINEDVSESVECFFVRRNLDLKRRTSLVEYTVTVFCPFERDGKQMLGSSSVHIYPEMEADEMEEALRSAYHAASFVANPWYELISGTARELVPASGGLAGRSLESCMEKMTEALFAAEKADGVDDTVFINSAEIFAKKFLVRIVNARGVDVSYETCEVSGEYVIQCVSPQDVETYHHFSYRDLDTEALRRDVEEALDMTRARARAEAAPKAGAYRVILSGEEMQTLLEYYVSRSSASMIYQKYSGYQTGMQVQISPGKDTVSPVEEGKTSGEALSPQGDLLTMVLKARNPYSWEGIPMKDRTLLEEGVLRLIHGDSRFAYYLGIEPTGSYDCMYVPVGETPLSEMKSGAYLHIVSFSDFQMDSFTGHFGGEIRLAFLCDGETVTPVTGGSMSGNILKSQGNMVFSKERYKNARYEGPFAVCFEDIQIAGQ